MNGKFLFDTNSVVYYLQGRSPWVKFIDDTAMTGRFASVITRMELLAYPDITTDEEDGICRFLSDLVVVPLDDAIETMTITMRRNTRLKLPDAIIAATAVILGATLITGDQRITDLDWPGLHTANPEL